MASEVGGVHGDQASAATQMSREIALASRVLLKHGIVDAFGHVSARHPERPDRFLMSRRLAPGLVRASDIREHGLDGELIDQDGTPVFNERNIHSSIYKARADVNAVIHSHSPGVVSFSVVADRPLRPISVVCAFLGGPVPVFDMRDFAGCDTDLLIHTANDGDALSAALGSGNVILMRGHGSTVCGSSLPQAVYNAIYTEENARMQAAAISLGEVKYLSSGEIELGAKLGGSGIERTWQFWKDELGDVDIG